MAFPFLLENRFLSPRQTSDKVKKSWQEFKGSAHGED